MALTVISRPQKELTVNNPPETYEESYYTSRWNASELPMQYQIESDLYPNNTVDSVDSFTVVDNDGGYARFLLTGSYETYLKFEYVEIITSSVSAYIGKWKIRKVFADYITLDLPFSATATGTLQRTYRNYYVNVRLYAGIDPDHPLTSEDPISLISTILVEPQLDNIAVIDVAGLVKSKVNGTVDFNSSQNHTNQWTSFYIEFAETYDVSNGTVVTSETTGYTLDVYEDCTESNELLDNDFETDPNDNWLNVESVSDIGGEPWIWTGSSMDAVLSSVYTDIYTQIFKQDFVFTQGLRYNLVFDIDVTSNKTGYFDVLLDAGLPTETLINRQLITVDGPLSVNTFFTPQSGFANIGFKFSLFLGGASLDYDALVNVNNFNVISGGCTAYIYSNYSKMPFQYVNGGNLGQFVQNSNNNVFENKFLTLFERPTYFLGKTFYLSTIIPQETLSLLAGVGGGSLRVIQYDRLNNALQTDRITIEQEGDGVYRFTFDSITFLSTTKYATAQLVIEPVNLFQDGDGGTFDTTSDPTGNPPTDWNLNKDARSVINFDDARLRQGTGSLSFESRTNFNDDYALYWTAKRNVDRPPSVSLDDWLKHIVCDDTDFDFTGNFSIEFRHYLISGTWAANFDVGYFFTVEYGTNRRFSIRFLNNTVQFQFTDSSGASRTLQNAADFDVDQWNHVIVAFENGVAARMYVNGVKTTITGTISLIGITSVNVTKIEIGGSTVNSSAKEPNGYGRGHRLYEAAIDDAQAASLYNSNRKVIQDVPLALQPFVYELLLNQEQGISVNNTEGLKVFSLKNWTSDEYAFGGGAWVDVSGI